MGLAALRMSIMAGLAAGGVPATLVSASECREALSLLKVELLRLYWVLSVEERSRLRTGVLERMGVDGLTASGRRDPEVRDRRVNPAVSGLGLPAEIAAGEGVGMSDSRREAAGSWGGLTPFAAAGSWEGLGVIPTATVWE